MLLQACKYPGYVAGQEVAILLIRHGADVNAGTPGDCPLIHALRNNESELAEYLILAGARITHLAKQETEKVSEVIARLASNPLSLSQLTRIAIREHISTRTNEALFHAMYQIPSLPADLKRYLLMEWL